MNLTETELSDEQVVERVLAGDTALFEIIMRRYNQRLYRVALAITRNDGEAEDIMQETYVRAYQHLRQFAGRAAFSTWLTRIAVHESIARRDHRLRFLEQGDSASNSEGDLMDHIPSEHPSPEERASSAEAARLLEQSVQSLPEIYRTIFVMRGLEEMSTAETAELLELSEENVKTRLHRARAMLRRNLYERAGATSTAAFQFHATRCNRVVKAVFERITGM
ncbi:MAG: RNA polymerase sigma factor [Acidobacteriaceae bacterium]|nr:RNA polymerase sigma factor [Acidobacteriaceae bacterium]